MSAPQKFREVGERSAGRGEIWDRIWCLKSTWEKQFKSVYDLTAESQALKADSL